MKKIIATTTVNPPTRAIRKYDAMPDWELLVVGDKKTPEYKLDRGTFLDWKYVEANYPDLVKIIGFDSVRLGRMVAWIEAYKRGAEILASIDDDCYPEPYWGKNVAVGQTVTARKFSTDFPCFNPMLYGSWHRGFPLELLGKYQITYEGYDQINVLVQEDQCLGQSDLDATQRIGRNEQISYDREPYWSDAPFSPVNTQNTFLHRSAIRDFPANVPFIGRADDIWAGYMFQAVHPQSTLYAPPSAVHVQHRDVQSVVDDLEEELFSYRNTTKFLSAVNALGVGAALKTCLPDKAVEAIWIYRSHFDD